MALMVIPIVTFSQYGIRTLGGPETTVAFGIILGFRIGDALLTTLCKIEDTIQLE